MLIFIWREADKSLDNVGHSNPTHLWSGKLKMEKSQLKKYFKIKPMIIFLIFRVEKN
jgi:hypothetical protein